MLGQRVRTPFGELDVVAVRGDELLCVEVKTGRAPLCAGAWRPADRHRWRARRRQARAASYLARRLGGSLRVRVALLEVLVDERGGVRLCGEHDQPGAGGPGPAA